MNKTNSNLEFRKIKSLKFLYEINENGTIIRNVKSKKQLKIKLDFHHSDIGYYVTFVHLGGRKNPTIKRVMIHSAVAECWLGQMPDGYEIDHRDRNPHNNDYRNLRYVTKSDQMKNRNNSNISKFGTVNLETARKERMKAVKLIEKKTNNVLNFESFSACARFLSEKYNKSFSAMKDKLTKNRSFIYEYNVKYLNAETRHGDSTE